MREAKLRTSWLCPDTAYEEALARYIDGVLRPPFTDELQKFVARIAPFGFRNNLVELALKCTAPGVPDLYQGCEQWNFSLVDPDNRRPVDYERLAQGLEAVQALYAQGHPSPEDWHDLLQNMADGRIKQLAAWRLLALRRALPALFRDGGYVPLAAEGPAAEHAIAYARQHEGQAVVLVGTRLAYTLAGGDDAAWSPALWAGTQLRWPAEPGHLRRFHTWRNWLTGRTVTPLENEDRGFDTQAVFDSAAHLPFAVLVGEETA